MLADSRLLFGTPESLSYSQYSRCADLLNNYKMCFCFSMPYIRPTKKLTVNTEKFFLSICVMCTKIRKKWENY